MSLLAALRAARSYSDAEATRQASFGLLPEVIPDFNGLPNITFRDGVADLLIDPRHQPRTFDVPVAFALKIAEGLGGNLLINCREKRSATARAYVRLDFAPVGIYVNRVIMNATVGKVVRETGANYRSHLPEHLYVEEAPLRDGPNKHINGRWDAIQTILEAYDKSAAGAKALITRDGLETLLSGLFVLADGRALERQAQANI